MVTASPCAAPPGLQPRANQTLVSRSSRRRFRMRRTAVLKSKMSSCAIMEALKPRNTISVVNMHVPPSSVNDATSSTAGRCSQLLGQTQQAGVLPQTATPSVHEVIVVSDAESAVHTSTATLLRSLAMFVSQSVEYLDSLHAEALAEEEVEPQPVSLHSWEPELSNACGDVDVDFDLSIMVRARANDFLDKLWEAAGFFNDNSFDSHEDVLYSYWSLFDPLGVQQRHDDNTRIEEEVLEFEVNYVGHLLVSDLVAFGKHLVKNSSVKNSELMRLAGRVTLDRHSLFRLFRSSFEGEFLAVSERAYLWQELLDDELLLALLRALRVHVKTVEYLTHLP